MPDHKKARKTPSAKPGLSTHALSLKIETTDSKTRNVNVDDFLKTAEKWLSALKAFALEQGELVKWEIVDLKKSSAFIQVQPVKVNTRKPAAKLVKAWDEGLRKIEKTGQPPAKFTPTSLAALEEFVFSVPQNTVVSVGNGLAAAALPITALTQRRVEEAAHRLPLDVSREYVSHGSVRGRLAVLDSWKPEERSFHLQLPLAPDRHVRCTYRDPTLVTSLGSGFEGTVEITGLLRYKPEQPWPYAADVDRIRVLPRSAEVSLRDLVGLIHLPEGFDSVSYIRSVRDAE
jgi:hypothetical protein